MPDSARSALVLALTLALPLPLLAAGRPAAAPAAAKLELKPCHVPGTEEEVRCGTFPVWEDREAKKGRRIDLNVVVLPALGPDRAPDPIFYFAGGPGEGASTTMDWVKDLKELRRRREIVLVDQRGTGKSNPLRCDFYGNPVDLQRAAGDLYSPEAVERCRVELEKVANLTLYTTAIGMDDVDEVRAALGYDRINLLGGSYGTRAAQVYLRRHPASVRSVILDGVAPVDETLPLHHAYAGKRAVDLLFAECAADAACRAAFPQIGDELRAVFERIDRGVTVTLKDEETGKTVEVRPSRGLVAEGIRFFLYNGGDGENTLPLQIHRAFKGDLASLVGTSIQRRLGIDQALSMGMLFSVTCAEDLPWIDAAAAARETAGTYLEDYRITQQKRACAHWPRAAVPADVHTPVRSSVPVFLISGERDPVTPPEFGARVARSLPNSLHLVLPHGSHGGIGASPCLEGIARDFLDRAAVRGLDTTCVARLPAARFATGVAK
ncbi:MAG TPA: alpha/beta hydrolase [Thermoanaerobaculia bacterium]|jgi:pimeloyl-ACP methyl ester carboxylesterase|nr:alpha/beta hydrolase [Thermoanaerobaculia bacterium]